MRPAKVLISGGRASGGVDSFAESLSEGFRSLGVSAEVVSPAKMLWRWRELRDPDVLKILSTSAVFAAPYARRALCVAHGFPRADVQGWLRLAGIVASFKLASRCSRLIAVSHYAAVHLRTIFNLRVDGVIHNPLHRAFLEPVPEAASRNLITFVGRLHPCKRLDRIVPAICALVEGNPELRACLIGEGELRGELEAMIAGHPRVEMTGALPHDEVRSYLRQTRLFVSGCETEALGIAYLEALSQGCVVAMPACGGGLEIAPAEIGGSVQLLPLPLEPGEVLKQLRAALQLKQAVIALNRFDPTAIAQRYLDADAARLAPETEVVLQAPAGGRLG